MEPEQQPAEAQPAWFVVVLGLGLAVLVAALCFFALAALGAEQVGTGFVVLVAVLSAVVGGFLSRSLAAKLPPLRRTR